MFESVLTTTQTPKLSIITVNLNNAKGLHKTIKSVVSQTNHDFEYIIIDGGSTDGSVEVIKSYTDIPQGTYSNINKEYFALRAKHFKPITYWISETDHGIYHAMNKGIMVAKGEYCQFLNSGDFLAAPDVLNKMLHSIPECSIYYGNMLKIMPNDKIIRDTCTRGNITMLTFYLGTLNHSPAFIKRDLFEKYGLYDETLQIVSDWKWYLNAIGLNNESVRYNDIDVTYFDMLGISTVHIKMEKQERYKVLKALLPASILADYDTHWKELDQRSRVNRYKITRWLLWFVDRIIFKFERMILV